MMRIFLSLLAILSICDFVHTQQNRILDINSVRDSINTLESEGQYEEAISILHLIKNYNHSNGLDDGLEIDIKLFNNYLSLGNIEKTNALIDTVEEQLIHTDTSAINNEQLGFYYHKKGVYFYRIDNYSESIESYKQAIKCREIALGHNDLTVVKSLNNLGHSYFENDELKKSADAFQESVKRHLINKDRDEFLLQSTYSYLSYSLTELNELVEANKYLQASVTMAEKLYPDDPIYLAELYSTDVFHFHKISEDHVSMISSNKKALSILDTISNKDEYTFTAMANCYNNLAISYESSEQEELAKAYYIKSIDLNKKFIENGEKLIHNYLNLSALNLITGDIEGSSQNISAAGEILSSINDSITSSWFYYRQAQILKAEKEYKKAIINYEKSISFLYSKDRPSANIIKGNMVQYCEILHDFSEVYAIQYEESLDTNHLLKYYNLFMKIDHTIALLRDELNDADSKLFISKKSREIYDYAMDRLFKLYDQNKEHKYLEDCFSIAEKTKALVIVEELNQRKAIIESGLSKNVMPVIIDLKNNVIEIENNINNEIDIEYNQEQLIKERIKLNSLYDSISIQHPKYSLLRTDNKSISIAEIQSKYCDKSTGVIQYYFTENKLFIFYIDNKISTLSRIKHVNNIPASISNLRMQLRKSINKLTYTKIERTARYDSLLVSSQHLYDLLIKPVNSKFNNIQKLLIVPDKTLAYLPFDLLTFNGEEDNFMVHDFNISYAYSMSLHDHMSEKSNNNTASNKLLAFAPSFSNNISLTDLPFNTEEVAEINQIISSDIYTNEHATKEKFIDEYDNYNLIHLSTHAVVNDTLPAKSLIAFSNKNSDATNQNVLLTEEIYNLNSNADLIFLSACETGIGKIEEGEGVMSIARAWASTGIKSIITTLWRIDDLFTSKFTAEFYKKLSNGSTRSESLWQTKKQFIADGVYSHPYYWSAFSLIGNNTSIKIQNKTLQTNHVYIGIIMGLLSGLLAIYWIKNRPDVIRKSKER